MVWLEDRYIKVTLINMLKKIEEKMDEMGGKKNILREFKCRK